MADGCIVSNQYITESLSELTTCGIVDLTSLLITLQKQKVWHPT